MSAAAADRRPCPCCGALMWRGSQRCRACRTKQQAAQAARSLRDAGRERRRYHGPAGPPLSRRSLKALTAHRAARESGDGLGVFLAAQTFARARAADWGLYVGGAS